MKTTKILRCPKGHETEVGAYERNEKACACGAVASRSISHPTDTTKRSEKPTAPKAKKNYVDNAELETTWFTWLDTEDPQKWQRLCEDVYKICEGVAKNFKPRDAEELAELAHEACTATLIKIRERKMQPIRGKAPVFNLLTTAIFRHLYSLKNKANNRKSLLTKHIANTSRDPNFGVHTDNFIERRG